MSSFGSDFVRDSKLDTTFADGDVHHVSYSSSNQRRRIRLEETWQRRKQLGSGAYGQVWLQSCVSGPKTGQLRAVKEIAKLRGSESSRAIDYNKELEATAKFSHEKYVHCFVRSFGWYENEDVVFISMEFFEHGDLQKHMLQPLPEIESREITSQLVEGLGFMHDNHFAHRDLKPGNILVFKPGPDWWVKIGDFGITKRAEEGATALRTVVGTRGYLAPEVIGVFHRSMQGHEGPSDGNGDPTPYTFAVDIWALGEIVFRLMTKASAFPTPRDLFDYVVYEKKFPLESLRYHQASQACCEFIKKVMAAAPQNRPTASEASGLPWMQGLSKAFTFNAQEAQDDAPGIGLVNHMASVMSVSDNSGNSELTDPYAATANWSTLAPGEKRDIATGQTDHVLEQTNPTAASASWTTMNTSKDLAKLSPIPSDELNEGFKEDIGTSSPQMSHNIDTSGGPNADTLRPISSALSRSPAYKSPSPSRMNLEKKNPGLFDFFRRKTKPPVNQPLQHFKHVFGVALATSIQYANIPIATTDSEGVQHIYGYIPIIVAKCGLFLKETATEVDEIFALQGEDKEVRELITIFDSPDRYGKGLVWDGYTVHDAATVLLRYLNELPEPLVPSDQYWNFLQPLEGLMGDIDTPLTYSELDLSEMVRKYQELITTLPPLNRQLLQYVLDMVAVFASKSDINHMTAQRMAETFMPCILRSPSSQVSPREYRLARSVVILLIEKEDEILASINGKSS